jgi:uncharacterized membrane protein
MESAGLLVWWLIITALGLVATPITLRIFAFLPDRGYAFAKPLGLLLVGLLSWLFGFVHFSTGTILFAVALVAGLAYWVWKQDEGAVRRFFQDRLGHVLVVEMFFLGLFLFFLAFRMFNPDIIGTEKFMDLAFLNSLTRAGSFPPYDPWLAGSGFSISYYYFGYLLMAIVTKLAGTPPAVAFNLALGLLFALAGTACFGLLFALTRRLWAALAGWAVIFLLGNLDGARQVLTTGTIENFNWWTPSRVIPDTINEFPFFSFLLGDMHPHMLDIPFFLISLALAFNHLRDDDADVGLRRKGRLGTYVLWGLVIGALGFINSWDLPTAYFVALAAFALQQARLRPRPADWPWRDLAAALGVILACAVVPYLPFYATFHSQAKGLGLTSQNTRTLDYVLVFGVPLFLALTFAAARTHAWFVQVLAPAPAARDEKHTHPCPACGRPVREGKRFCGHCGHPLEPAAASGSPLALPAAEVPGPVREAFLFLLQPAARLQRGEGRASAFAALALLIVLGAAAFFKSPFLALAVLALAALALLLAVRVDRPESAFALVLIFTAALLTFGAEVLHIRDTFTPPLDRMNTVFKFYYQIWFLLGVGGAYGVFWLWRHSLRTTIWRALWLAPLGVLVAASLVYPYAAALIKTNHFANYATLDGSWYLRGSYPGDLAGIEWLRRHAQGSPVVLEATGAEYTDFARVSTFTGLPTVLGWAGHELQWRGNYDEPSKRIPDIDTLYTSQDLGRVQALLDQYRIEYVFVGTLERGKYPEPGLSKFGSLMRTVYQHPSGVIIYQRR